MNNLKKVGLTALGTAMVSAAATTGSFAGDLSVTGSMAMAFYGRDNSDMGNGWTLTDAITFSGSTELDNGWTVSISHLLDGGNEDDSSLAIDTGDMGKITFGGHELSGPLAAWDDLTPSANEEAHGVTVAGTIDGAINAAGTDSNFVWDYTAMDNVVIKAAYFPSTGDTANGVESSTEIGVQYTGVEGLDVRYAQGENNTQSTAANTPNGKVEATAFYVGYAMDAFTIGTQSNESDSDTADEDEDFTSYGISYAVSDDLSISYNVSEIDYESSTLSNQEATGVSFSYTSGGMTVSGAMSDVDNVGGTATADNSGYELNLSFAF